MSSANTNNANKKARFAEIINDDEESIHSLDSIQEDGQQMDEVAEREMSPVPMTQSLKDHGTFLTFLECVWEDKTTLSIMERVLAGAKKEALKKRMLQLTKKLYGIRQAMMDATKKIQKNNASLTCSLSRFKRLCQDEELFTIFTREILTKEDVDCLIDAWEQVTQEPSSSFAAMGTTTTSSTTAHTTPARADARGTKRSKTPDSSDTDDDLFAPTSSHYGIGGISQNISKRVNGQWISYTSPGERGYNIVKVDIIPFAEAQTMDKSNWWKIASTRSLFITGSAVDPLQIATDTLMKNAMKGLKKLDLKKDVKGTELRNSFKNIQHHP